MPTESGGSTSESAHHHPQSNRLISPSHRITTQATPTTNNMAASMPESESGASTASNETTPEPQSHSTDTDGALHNIESEVSFVSVDDDKKEDQEELLLDFSNEERNAVFRVSEISIVVNLIFIAF